MAAEDQPINPLGKDIPTIPEGISVLDRIREQLRKNPDLFIAGEIVTDHNSLHSSFKQTVTIIAAPRHPLSLFDAGKLNRFTRRLLKGIKPSSHDKAKRHRDGGIELGVLYFDEPKGHENDRKTMVRMYPDELSAKVIFGYEKGVGNGTIAQNDTCNRMRKRITGKQIRRMESVQSLR